MTNAPKRLAAAMLVATFLAACGGGDGDGRLPEGGVGGPGGPGGAAPGFSVNNAVTLMQLCLESYQMLTDFQNGKTFTLPAPYTLQAQDVTHGTSNEMLTPQIHAISLWAGVKAGAYTLITGATRPRTPPNPPVIPRLGRTDR